MSSPLPFFLRGAYSPAMKFPKQILFFLLLTVSFFAPTVGCLQAQESKAARETNLLWKVQGKTNSVYLFGSIHFLKKEFYPLAKPIEAAYEKSGIVVFETDFEEMKASETQRKLAKIGTMPAGETIESQLSKETYDALQNYLKEAVGVPNLLDRVKPWMASIALLGLELQRLGFSPEQGVDQYFLRRAQKDGKEIIPLETLEFQLSLFSDLTKEEQEAMLQETLQEISTFKTVIDDMVAAWKSGNAEKLDALVHDNMKNYPKLYKKMLVDRNEQWMTKIEKLLERDKDVFIVVGAAHLVGKDSVIEMLKKKKFRLEQL